MKLIPMKSRRACKKIEFIWFSFCLLFFLFSNLIEDLKLVQKLRQRKKGLSAEELALGKQSNPLLRNRKADVCVILSYRMKISKLFFCFYSQMIHLN